MTDPLNATIIRKVGLDWLALAALPTGFPEGDIVFYHQSAGCSDNRLLLTSNTWGLVYPAQVHSGAMFYTKTIDPGYLISVTVPYKEVIPAGVDVTTVTDRARYCQDSEFGTFGQSVGTLVTASDSAMATFVTPFRIK